MRLNIPTVFVSGGPMEAGKFQGRSVDLIDAMVMGADETCSDALDLGDLRVPPSLSGSSHPHSRHHGTRLWRALCFMPAYV